VHHTILVGQPDPLHQQKTQTGQSIPVEEWYITPSVFNTNTPHCCPNTIARTQMIIQARDARNPDGMVRKEIVGLIAQMGEVDSKSSDNHYYNCIALVSTNIYIYLILLV
jgi:hypothetical protein